MKNFLKWTIGFSGMLVFVICFLAMKDVFYGIVSMEGAIEIIAKLLSGQVLGMIASFVLGYSICERKMKK